MVNQTLKSSTSINRKTPQLGFFIMRVVMVNNNFRYNVSQELFLILHVYSSLTHRR